MFDSLTSSAAYTRLYLSTFTLADFLRLQLYFLHYLLCVLGASCSLQALVAQEVTLLDTMHVRGLRANAGQYIPFNDAVATLYWPNGSTLAGLAPVRLQRRINPHIRWIKPSGQYSWGPYIDREFSRGLLPFQRLGSQLVSTAIEYETINDDFIELISRFHNTSTGTTSPVSVTHFNLQTEWQQLLGSVQASSFYGDYLATASLMTRSKRAISRVNPGGNELNVTVLDVDGEVIAHLRKALSDLRGFYKLKDVLADGLGGAHVLLEHTPWRANVALLPDGRPFNFVLASLLPGAKDFVLTEVAPPGYYVQEIRMLQDGASSPCVVATLQRGALTSVEAFYRLDLTQLAKPAIRVELTREQLVDLPNRISALGGAGIRKISVEMHLIDALLDGWGNVTYLLERRASSILTNGAAGTSRFRRLDNDRDDLMMVTLSDQGTLSGIVHIPKRQLWRDAPYSGGLLIQLGTKTAVVYNEMQDNLDTPLDIKKPRMVDFEYAFPVIAYQEEGKVIREPIYFAGNEEFVPLLLPEMPRFELGSTYLLSLQPRYPSYRGSVFWTSWPFE